MTYKHLTIEEREKIQEMLWQKISMRKIAKELGRSPSSISRELKKYRSQRNKYTPRTAHQKAMLNRKKRGREERLKSEALRKYVIKQLKEGWSPEQIAGISSKKVGISISHEAIYQYIYAQIKHSGRGQVKLGKLDLRPYLARRRKYRMKQGMRKPQNTKRGILPSIDERPKEVEKREIIGHWEDDCVVSKASLWQLKTINERVSGIVFITRIKQGTIEEANQAVTRRLGAVPAPYRKTLTRDRGSENLGYEELEKSLGINCYFAHAYASWERGSNENVNGLIRRYFPKKTDFSTISDEQVKKVEYLLNSRPRKRLGWKTPYEVFKNLTGVALKS